MIRRREPVRITELIAAERPGAEASALVDGDRVWFRSPDVALRMTPTAMASAFLLPSMAARRTLSVEGALSRRWRHGARELQRTYAEWWGYRRVRVRCAPAEAAPRLGPGGSPGRALTFSGGVDSFYSLLRGGRPDYLVTVRGFDMALDDDVRWRGLLATVSDVARRVGCEPVVVETSLRENPLFGSVNWERTHGGALAAVGHLLTDRIVTLTIAATLTDEFQPPWGSHPRTDHLWGSEELEIEHQGTALWRHEKLWEIQDEPLVREHLRVCWENRAPSGNCGRCDKCLITMLVLKARGRLGDFPTFDPPPSFPAELDRLPRTTFLRTIGLLLEEPLGDATRDALRRLRDRTARLRAHTP